MPVPGAKAGSEPWRTSRDALDGIHRYFEAPDAILAPAIAALGADVDDMVGGFHHIEIMFDHDDGIALIDQFMQHFEQFAHIFEMQTRCRLIKNVKCSAG